MIIGSQASSKVPSIDQVPEMLPKPTRVRDHKTSIIDLGVGDKVVALKRILAIVTVWPLSGQVHEQI